METIEYKNGFKVIINYPDFTPEEKEKADQELLDKLCDIFYDKNKALTQN